MAHNCLPLPLLSSTSSFCHLYLRTSCHGNFTCEEPVVMATVAAAMATITREADIEVWVLSGVHVVAAVADLGSTTLFVLSLGNVLDYAM